MSNQFDAKIRFDPIAWYARDVETGAHCYVVEEELTKWWVIRLGKRVAEGEAKSPTGGRAACRRAVEKLRPKLAPRKRKRRS